VSGHDAVAYFTEGRPVPGRSDVTHRHEGVEWRFATPENRERFRANPARYAPQFGGYCSWAVSQGYTAPADPTAWAIRDGKLYLNYDHSVQREWEKDAPGNIVKGRTNWPGILARK
jgi:YHS domain-containing protein